MKKTTQQLLQELESMTKQHLSQAQQMQSLSKTVLANRPHPESWSALECIEHLNRYANFYHPEIESQIMKSNTTPSIYFKSGWLGNYFANSMLPREKLNKMKTFRSMNPMEEPLDFSTLTHFEQHLQKLLHLLHCSKSVNLEKVKTAISISSLIKLKLGDTFRFVIYHNERHLQQATQAIQSYQ